MQAVIGDDAFDTADANGKAGLAKLLRDDRGGSVCIQKSVAQDLTNGFIGATVVGFWSGLLGFKGEQAAAQKGIAELIITLTATTMFFCDVGDVGSKTFAFHQHKKAAGEFIGGGDGEGADGAFELA